LRIALVHAFFDDAGGNERLALEMYRALRDLGHEVDLYTAHVNERAWEVLTSGMKDVPRPVVLGEPLVTRLLRPTGRLVRYRRLVAASALAGRLARQGRGHDIVIETQTNAPMPWADASYIHFPALIDYVTLQASGGLTRRLYDWLISREVRRVGRGGSLVMTNSSWTAGYIRRAYGDLRIEVVHPPVNVEELLPLGEHEARS